MQYIYIKYLLQLCYKDRYSYVTVMLQGRFRDPVVDEDRGAPQHVNY